MLVSFFVTNNYAQENKAKNPVIYADVPDLSIIRVGSTYYMSSTTMHMNPGVPIMKSNDLVNWKLINYAYETLEDNDERLKSLCLLPSCGSFFWRIDIISFTNRTWNICFLPGADYKK